jgi:hypothetical protein
MRPLANWTSHGPFPYFLVQIAVLGIPSMREIRPVVPMALRSRESRRRAGARAETLIITDPGLPWGYCRGLLVILRCVCTSEVAASLHLYSICRVKPYRLASADVLYLSPSCGEGGHNGLQNIVRRRLADCNPICLCRRDLGMRPACRYHGKRDLVPWPGDLSYDVRAREKVYVCLVCA